MALTDAQLAALRTHVLLTMTKTALVIDRMNKWMALNNFDPYYAEVENKKLALERELAMLTEIVENLQNRRNRLHPPDDDQVATITRLANEVDQLIQSQATADQLIELANKVLLLDLEVRSVGTFANAP
jgi:hypothetical protein